MIFGEKRNHRAIMVLGIGVFFELTRERGDVLGYFFFGEKEVMIYFFLMMERRANKNQPMLDRA